MVPTATWVSRGGRSVAGFVRRRASAGLLAVAIVTIGAAGGLGSPGTPAAREGATTPAATTGAAGAAAATVATGPAAHAAVEARKETPEARVRSILERTCLGCHAAAGPAPVGGLVLARPIDPAAVAADRGLVQSGNPDASPLYTVPLLGRAPHDRLGRGDDGSGLDAADMAALRSWIELGPTPRSATCRALLGTEDGALLDAARAVEGVPEHDRPHRRFVSLAALHGGCTSEADLESYRRALQWALFSTARSRAPLVSRFVGQDRTVLELDLAALAWMEDDWLRLVEEPAFAPGTDPAVAAYLQAATGSANPITRADRLAARLLQPEVYRQLLQAPATMAVLLSSARVDVVAPTTAASAARLLLPESSFTAGPRLLERRSSPRGALWLAWSMSDPEARSKLDASPTLGIGENGLRVDGARAIWHLPNGLPAFFATGVDTVGGAGVGDGGSLRCLTCHALGPAAKATASASEPGRVPVIEAEERRALAALVEEARSASRVATARLGLADVETFTVDGLPALIALARRHRDRLGFEAAALEAGVSLSDLRTRLRARGAEADGTIALLEQGLARRAQLTRLLAPATASASVTASGPASGPAAAPVAAAPARRTSVDLWARLDKERYRTGDLVTLTLGAERDCHITVLNVEGSGRTTILLPNDFETTAFLPAGRTLQLPSPSSAFQLRAGVPGRERLIVLCNDVPPGQDGIAHDFERQKFTDLGDFTALLEQVWNAEPLTATSAIVAARAARTRPPRRGRRRAARSRPSVPPAPITAPILAPLAWTGVVVDIAPRENR